MVCDGRQVEIVQIHERGRGEQAQMRNKNDRRCFFDDHEDIDLNTNNFRLKDVTRIITGLDKISVQNSLFCH